METLIYKGNIFILVESAQDQLRQIKGKKEGSKHQNKHQNFQVFTLIHNNLIKLPSAFLFIYGAQQTFIRFNFNLASRIMVQPSPGR